MATGTYINFNKHSGSSNLHSRTGYTVRNRLTYALCVFLVGIVGLVWLSIHSSIPSSQILTLIPVTWKATKDQSDIRIAKATILYSPSNSVYDHALALHEEHNKKWGYEMHILRTPVVKGSSDTLLWLQHTIITELQKPVEERTEWILSFDPSVLLTNPNIPLHIFLPPLSPDPETFKSLSIIASKPDQLALSTDVFFIRVSPLSLRILTLAMAAVHSEPTRDWGKDIVGATLQYVLEKEEYRDKVVYQPASWFNVTAAVFTQLWGLSRVEGVLGIESTLSRDKKTLDVRESYPGTEEVKMFWDTVTEAKHVLNEAKDRGHAEEKGEFRDEVRAVKYCVEISTWDVEGMRRNVEVLKARLGVGEIIGFETVVG